VVPPPIPPLLLVIIVRCHLAGGKICTELSTFSRSDYQGYKSSRMIVVFDRERGGI
jgi:hypothetical protein